MHLTDSIFVQLQWQHLILIVTKTWQIRNRNLSFNTSFVTSIRFKGLKKLPLRCLEEPAILHSNFGEMGIGEGDTGLIEKFITRQMLFLFRIIVTSIENILVTSMMFCYFQLS